jgi:hypothetical protein
MNCPIRNTAAQTKWYLDTCDKAFKVTGDYILNKYNINIFEQDNFEVYVSHTGRFSKFVEKNNRKGFDKFGIVRILAKSRTWSTYSLKRIGLEANNIPCDCFESTSLQMVHEFTHYIQLKEGRKMGEVEATLNEIEFAKEYYPYLYEQLIKI